MFFILYIDVIISYSFKTARSPGEKQAEKRGVLDVDLSNDVMPHRNESSILKVNDGVPIQQALTSSK